MPVVLPANVNRRPRQSGKGRYENRLTEFAPLVDQGQGAVRKATSSPFVVPAALTATVR
jgi:hypothetical protein